MNQKLLWIMIGCIIIINASQVHSVVTSCVLNTLRTPAIYHAGETITWDIVCSSATDRGKLYSLQIKNSTNTVIATLTGTTSATDGIHVFHNWVIPSNYGNQNNSKGTITVSGTTGNSTKIFNITGIATDKISVHSIKVLYNGSWYWNEINSISASLKNYLGQPVIGAICKLDVYSSVGLSPYATQDSSRSGADGKILFNLYTDYNQFDVDTSYAFIISCQGLTGQTIGTGNAEINGYGGGFFTIQNDVIINEVYPKSRKSTIQAEENDAICINLTNNRRYDTELNIRYSLLCDIPNQDVNVAIINGHESLNIGQTATFCPPIKIPDTASYGTGLCKFNIAVDAGQQSNIEDYDDYISNSSRIRVIPAYTDIIQGFRKVNITSWVANLTVRNNISSGSILRTFIPEEIASMGDKVKSITYHVGNISYSGTISVDTISEFDKFTEGENTKEVVNVQTVSPSTIPKNYNFSITITLYSEASFWEKLISRLDAIISALQHFITGTSVDVASVGNYTNIISSLKTTTVGSSALIAKYNITGGSSTKRRNLHFIYEFAPKNASVEGAFRDQNPSIKGYQALEVYQAIQLNQTKSLNLTLSPNLKIGTYVMYETIYELNSPQQVSSGNELRDERIIKQNHYTITVNALMIPEFNGDIIEVNGVLASALS